MRHKVVKHHFGRKPDARKALIRGLVDALVEHGRIKTTLPKAKELRRHVEKAVTIGKNDTVHARRVLVSKYPNKNTVRTLVSDLGQRFKERPGGYTRITKIGPRPGDMAEMAYIEFVDYQAPDISEQEREDAGLKQARATAKVRKAKKKRLRNMQAASRKINRK
ncbi:MAG: 50S ribosomal protein L17 [Bdellovibrionaceae bacterium]|nr:50S ribosomal protein L17 [Pseudobdellovibrionaceae bacterium]|tara:strand:+ start:46496 stop:46987 length:492 start_codon:yes stop_codon:yes gene_type:complete